MNKRKIIVIIVMLLLSLYGCTQQNNKITLEIQLPNFYINSGSGFTYEVPFNLPISNIDTDNENIKVEIKPYNNTLQYEKLDACMKYNNKKLYKSITISSKYKTTERFGKYELDNYNGLLRVTLDMSEIRTPDELNQVVYLESGYYIYNNIFDGSQQAILIDNEITEENLISMVENTNKLSIQKYLDNEENIEKLTAFFRPLTENIYSQDLNDYEKTKMIYDWIVTNISYENEVEKQTDLTGTYDPKFNSIKYIIENRKTGCGGYANLFELAGIMYKLDVYKITGMSTDRNEHIWNAVYDREAKAFIQVDTTYGVVYYNDSLTYLPNENFSKRHLVLDSNKRSYVPITEGYIRIEK